MSFWKNIRDKFRPACKPADAITKQDLQETERAIVTAMTGFEKRIYSAVSDLAAFQIATLKETENKLMKTLQEVLDDVADESTRIDSLTTLTAGIKAQLDEVLKGALTPEQQAKVDAIFTAVETNKSKVQAAIDANTTPPTP